MTPEAKAFSRITTDETLLENARHGSPAFPFQYYFEDVWDFDFHCVDWHWHPELEYVYVQSGRAVCFVGEEKTAVEAGQGLLINSRALHRFEAKGSTVIPNAVYSPLLLAPEDSLIHQKYLRPFLDGGADWVLFSPEIPWQAACIRKMRQVFEAQEQGEDAALQTVILLMQFWGILGKNLRLPPENAEKKPARPDRARLQVMMQYLQEHFRESVRLEDLGAAVHVGRSAVLRIFQQGIRQSPIAYLIRYRLKRAALLLTSTEKPVVRIAEETGFESATYFCRKFKALYGVTPREYRKKGPQPSA